MTPPNYRILYKNHGDSIGTWEGWTDGATVFTQSSKKLDGQAVQHQYQAEAKNVGRANAVTPDEQAVLELDSKTRLKLDKGYVTELAQASVPATNTLGLERPKLATPIDKVKPESIDWDNSWMQPKLDGHRALFKDGVLYSRQGKVLNVPHINEAIKASRLDDLHLDGELYLHGKSLQELSSLIKKQTADSLYLEYHIYDVVAQGPYIERVQPLIERSPGGKDPRIILVDTFAAIEMGNVMLRHGIWRGMGYEGTMLRHGDTPYRDGKRCQSLLKIKEFHDAEFTVLAVEEGKPRFTQNMWFNMPVWTLDAGNGETFTCLAHGNMHERDQQWADRDLYIGKQLTVQYHYLSKKGIPQLPIALRWRDDI